MTVKSEVRKYLVKSAWALVRVSVVFLLVFALSCTAKKSQEQAAAKGAEGEDKKLTLVATTTMLSDIAREIGGDTIEVIALMGPGIDPHLYQASAGDVGKMQKADIVLYNGLHLEGKMGDVFAALKGQQKTIICIEEGLDPSLLLADEDDASVVDPHVWFDVAIWKQAAVFFTGELVKTNQKMADVYNKNLASYLAELDALDTYIKNRVQELPVNQRVLITAHDAFRYFGRAYGIEVKGLQGISTDAEAGTADMSRMAAFIAEQKIKAIFVESSVPPKTIEALQAAVKARGFDVAIGGELYSDSLGDEASGHQTYVLTCKANIDTIVEALK